MRPIDQEYMEDLKELSRDALKEIRALFAYQGNDARYFQRAKVAIGVIGTYKGMVAAENNRTALEQMAGGATSGAVLPEKSGDD